MTINDSLTTQCIGAEIQENEGNKNAIKSLYQRFSEDQFSKSQLVYKTEVVELCWKYNYIGRLQSALIELKCTLFIS